MNTLNMDVHRNIAHQNVVVAVVVQHDMLMYVWVIVDVWSWGGPGCEQRGPGLW